MNTSVKSKLLAAALAFGLATPLTLTQSIVTATPAEAGVLGSIKSAAKSVGGAVKSGAKAVGGGTVTAAKAVGSASVVVGKRLGHAGADTGKTIGGFAVDGAKVVGRAGAAIGRGAAQDAKQIYNSRPGQAVVKFVKRTI